MAAPSGLRNARDERTTTSTCYHAGSEEKPVRFVSPPLPYTSTIAGASYKQEVLPAAAQAVAVRSSQTVAKANFSYGGETLQILQELFSWHSRTSSLPTLVCRRKIYAAKATKKKHHQPERRSFADPACSKLFKEKPVSVQVLQTVPAHGLKYTCLLSSLSLESLPVLVLLHHPPDGPPAILRVSLFGVMIIP